MAPPPPTPTKTSPPTLAGVVDELIKINDRMGMIQALITDYLIQHAEAEAQDLTTLRADVQSLRNLILR